MAHAPSAPSPPVPVTGSSAPGGRRLRSDTLVLLVTLLVAAALLGSKAHKALRLGATLGELPALLIADTAFVLGWGTAWTLLLRVRRRGLHLAARAAMHLATLGVLLFVILEHGFFLVTGTLGDWNLVLYTLRHLGQLEKVVLSEVGPPVYAAAAGALAVVALPWRYKVAAPTPGRPRDRRPPLLWGGLLAVSLLVLPLFGRLPLRGRLPSIRPTPMVAIAAAAVRQRVLDRAGVEVKVASQPVQPLLVARTEHTRPLNVVIIMLESIRARSATSYNPALRTMPFLDELARRGTLFEQAHTVVPHTSKSLVPIYCGIPAKLTPYVEEASRGALPSDCLPAVLRRIGYDTHYFQTPESGFERRADLIRAFGFAAITSSEELDDTGFQRVGYFGPEDDILIQPVLDWLDRKRNGPFLLGLLNVTSHHPYEVPRSFPKRKWPGAKGKLADYYDGLHYTDRWLSKLFAGFEARGLLDHTVFALVGDHGEGFGEHGLWQHGHTIHEEGLRVPLVLLGPGVPVGQRRGGLRQHIDLLPTVLHLLGLRILAGDLPGKDLLATAGHDELYFSCWRLRWCRATIADGRKIVYYFGRRDNEVYDLRHDPLEQHDLLADGTLGPADAQPYIDRMMAWSARVDGRYADQNERRRRLYVSGKPPADLGTPADITFDGWVKLIGYTVERSRLKDADATWVTTVLHVLRDPPRQDLLWMHATGPILRGHLKRRVADHVPVEGSYSIAQWKKGDYIVDRHLLRIKPGHPSGDYALTFGFWDPRTGRRAIPSGRGARLTPSAGVHLATLEVTNRQHPERRSPLTELDAEQRRRVHLHPPAEGFHGPTGVWDKLVALRGVTLPADLTATGVDHRWTLHFEVLGKLPRWTDIFVHVTGPDGPEGPPARNVVIRPFGGRLAVHEWRRGWFLDVHADIGVGAGAKPGRYDVWTGFWDPNLPDPTQRHPPVSKERIHARRLHIGSFVVRAAHGAPAEQAAP